MTCHPLKKKLINVLHILIVAPLLWALASNKFPEGYKKYIVWSAFLLAFYHLYLLCFSGIRAIDGISGTSVSPVVIIKEGYETTNNGYQVHHLRIYDAPPGHDLSNMTIKKGEIIVWTNIGELAHSVSEINGQFNSGYLKPGEQYAVLFVQPGTYRYQCLHHRGWQNGCITVV